MALMLNDPDNVAVALSEIAAGTFVSVVGRDGKELAALRSGGQIPKGHKIALTAIGRGKPVVKYGHAIGLASEAIQHGSHVHTHNLCSTRAVGELDGSPKPLVTYP